MKDTKINILGVNVNATTLDLAEVSIRSWISLGKKAYVCVVPVSTVVECQENPEYLNIVNLADMATPDGMPLVWLGRLKGNKVIQRTYGPDLMLKLCETGQKQGLKHYFYGGTTAVLEQLEARLKKESRSLILSENFHRHLLIRSNLWILNSRTILTGQNRIFYGSPWALPSRISGCTGTAINWKCRS